MKREKERNVENIPRLESTFGGERFDGKFRGIKLDDGELKPGREKRNVEDSVERDGYEKN